MRRKCVTEEQQRSWRSLYLAPKFVFLTFLSLQPRVSLWPVFIGTLKDHVWFFWLDNINPTVFNRPETLITDSNWFKLLAYWEHNNELSALIRGAVVTSGHCSWCSECVRLNTECCCAGIDHCLHVEIRFLWGFFLCNTGKNTNHWSSNLTPFHPE